MFLVPEGSKGGQRFWRERRVRLVWETDGEKVVGVAWTRVSVRRRVVRAEISFIVLSVLCWVLVWGDGFEMVVVL